MYTALRPFKYQAQDGQMKRAVVGQSYPEAKYWKNLGRLVGLGWMTDENGRGTDATRIGAITRMMQKETLRKEAQQSSASAVHDARSLAQMSKSEVKQIAASLGLADKGLKSDLIQSIVAAQG